MRDRRTPPEVHRCPAGPSVATVPLRPVCTRLRGRPHGGSVPDQPAPHSLFQIHRWGLAFRISAQVMLPGTPSPRGRHAARLNGMLDKAELLVARVHRQVTALQSDRADSRIALARPVVASEVHIGQRRRASIPRASTLIRCEPCTQYTAARSAQSAAPMAFISSTNNDPGASLASHATPAPHRCSGIVARAVRWGIASRGRAPPQSRPPKGASILRPTLRQDIAATVSSCIVRTGSRSGCAP